MKNSNMGFKHTMLQRLHNYDVSPVKISLTKTTPTSQTIPTGILTTARMNSNSEKSSPPAQVTDFSISRILSENKDKMQPPKFTVKKIPAAPLNASVSNVNRSKIQIASPLPSSTSSMDILDLSKSSSATVAYQSESAAQAMQLSAYQHSLAYHAALQPDLLGATSASKFYAQIFPHMFPSYANAMAAAAVASSAPYQKRYFAPYIFNGNNSFLPATSTSSRLTTSTVNGGKTGLNSLSPSDILRSKSSICTRADCTDCLADYYKPFQYKYPLQASSLPLLPIYNNGVKLNSISSNSNNNNNNNNHNNNSNSTTQFLKAKSSSELLLNAASGTISFTTMTNLNVADSTTSPTAIPTLGGYALSPAKADDAMANALNSEEISYKCRICDKVFGCSQTLQAHEKTHKSPRYECTDCGKGFSQLRNYKYHLSVHRGTKEFAAECPECGKTFNDKGYLSSHMKIHRNKKEYECPYCPKSFNQRVAFNMHVRIHTGVKPHKCAECGKRFSRKMLLKQHMRTHSGEKPYQCSVCGKSFADRSNMTLHHRLHSGIKPFNCPICPKAFTKKHHLKTHLNYHTGCKPYVCPHANCNQAFTQSSNMRTHAKKCQYRPLQLPSFPVSTTTTATANFTAGIQMLTTVAASAQNTATLTAATFPLRPF